MDRPQLYMIRALPQPSWELLADAEIEHYLGYLGQKEVEYGKRGRYPPGIWQNKVEYGSKVLQSKQNLAKQGGIWRNMVESGGNVAFYAGIWHFNPEFCYSWEDESEQHFGTIKEEKRVRTDVRTRGTQANRQKQQMQPTAGSLDSLRNKFDEEGGSNWKGMHTFLTPGSEKHEIGRTGVDQARAAEDTQTVVKKMRHSQSSRSYLSKVARSKPQGRETLSYNIG
ncbi:hypothetical protein B0H10DRAFT_1963210 [Mycena sp. CBHHK59/15]|nr:hypothetical protein B0H10DRAFT_1963210 [Mycena sp. CBHHK59/15]